MKQVLILAAVLLALAVAPVFAAPVLTPCPIPVSGSSGGLTVDPTYLANTAGGTINGCNALITFNANGSIVTTFPNAQPFYDSGGDDALIGVLNLRANPITAINLSSTLDIFGFDGDGACGDSATGALDTTGSGFTFAGQPPFPCAASVSPSGYGGPNVTFSGINSSFTSGTVNFGAGGIPANGGSTWFSLEERVTLDLQVVPEPASLALVGTGLLALGVIRRRRKSALRA